MGSWAARIDGEETVDGDPDSQIVYVNKVGTFGLSPASYWWTRIAACGIRATHHLLGPGYPMDMLLYADDLEALGIGARGRQGIPLCSASSGSAWRLTTPATSWGCRLNEPHGSRDG